MKGRVVTTAALVTLAATLGLLAPGMASAEAPRRAQPPTPTVPFDLGIGPAAFWLTGPVADDQLLHAGLRIETFVVLDRAFREQHRERIPPQYRKASARMKEIRFNPLSLFLPSHLIISPAVGGTGVYGGTWRPFGIGGAFPGRDLRLEIGAGLDLTYLFVHSDALPSPTHFLRPGLDLTANLEWNLARDLFMSLGWASTFYPPQEVGGSILEWGELERSIWHIGQAFLLLHVRFPVSARL